VTKLDRGEDGGREHGGGADGEGHVQAVGEGPAGGREQHLAGPGGELPGYRHRAAESVPRGRRGPARDPGQPGACQLAAVNAGADDAKERDAKRPAELGGGLRQRRRRPGTLGRCGAPTARSVAKVSTGASANWNTVDPVTRIPRPATLPSRVNRASPAAASARPAAMTKAGRIRRASTGVSRDPRMNPAEAGSIHTPAASGDRPSTSCMYWAMNSRVPNPTK
jgi:hypothetical protein